ncbi:MAG: carboxypeptidase regulatory-like domain-containing protein, partial [Blastocatellia bacterium]
EDHPLEGVRRERAAQVLFAAAGTVTDRDVQGEFGREAIESHRSEYATRYAQRVYQIAQQLVPELAGFYANHSPSSAGFEADLKAFAETSADHKKMIDDPWGNPLIGEGQLSQSNYVYLSLRSAGPDGRKGTADDVPMQVVAQRGGAGVQGPPVLIDGQVSVENAVIAGGRIEIKGTVKDESGDPVDRVLISARRRTNGRLSRVYSDTLGRFTIPDLSPGRYELKFERDGFKTSVSRMVTLSAGSRGKLEAVLEARGATPISLSVYPYYSRRDRGEMELDRVALADGPVNRRQLDVLKVAATGVPAAAPANEPMDLMGVNAVDEKEKKAENKPEAGGEPRVRSFFPETLYTNPALITDGQGRASIHVPVADSITTWRITSLASTVKGMLGSSTFPIKVFQDFFVDLDLPAAITQGDAISAPVAVYNYT